MAGLLTYSASPAAFPIRSRISGIAILNMDRGRNRITWNLQ